MSTIPLRQRDILARRLALGMSAADAARAAELTTKDVAVLMEDADFRDLLTSWHQILNADDEARRTRLLALSRTVLKEAAAKGSPEAIAFLADLDKDDGGTLH
jgi:hypothetical protein